MKRLALLLALLVLVGCAYHPGPTPPVPPIFYPVPPTPTPPPLPDPPDVIVDPVPPTEDMPTWEDLQTIYDPETGKPKEGLTQAEVEAALGTPVEEYKKFGSDDYWIRRYQVASESGQTALNVYVHTDAGVPVQINVR